MTDEQKKVLKNFLSGYTREHDIAGDLLLMPKWIQKLLNSIIKEETL